MTAELCTNAVSSVLSHGAHSSFPVAVNVLSSLLLAGKTESLSGFLAFTFCAQLLRLVLLVVRVWTLPVLLC